MQYLTTPCARIGRVQVSLLNAELVSDTYAIQSTLQAVKVADNYLEGQVFQCFSAVFYGFHVNLDTVFQCNLGSFFILKTQPKNPKQDILLPHISLTGGTFTCWINVSLSFQ